MEVPANILDRYAKPVAHGPRHEREEMLDMFLARLNPSRVKEGYEPLDHAALGTIFTGVPTADLFPFYRTCETAKSFGGMFWYLVKGKKKEV
jgi:hypothetical protein